MSTKDECLRGGGRGWAVQESNDPGLYPRLRGHVPFLLMVRQKGGCLLPQGQVAARGCRLRQRPERVTPGKKRQAAKTVFSSHPPPRVGDNLPLLVGRTMVSLYVFLALLGTDPVLSTAPVSVSNRT